VNGPIEKFTKSYFIDQGELEFAFISNDFDYRLVSESENKKVVEIFPTKETVRKNDEVVELTEIVQITDHFSKEGGSFDHTWSIPTEKILFEINFQDDDPPVNINYEILLGNTKVDHKYCEVQRTRNSIKINFSKHLERTKLVVSWSWWILAGTVL